MTSRCLVAWILLGGMLAPATVAGSADEIVEKHLEARGGLDRIKSVKSARLTGTMLLGGQMSAPFVWTWKRPDKMRMEFTVNGQTVIQAFDGESGWTVMPMMGITEPQPMSDEDAAQFAHQADFDGQFVDSEQKGYVIEYVGQEQVDGKAAHKLRVTDKDGETVYVYIDAESFLEIKTEGTRNIEGREVEFEVTQGDFGTVDGLVFAHSLENKAKSAPVGQSVTFEEIELDVDVDDSIFAMPAIEELATPEGVDVEVDGSE